MSFIIRRALRFAAQKVASDPRAREKAGQYARLISEEVRTISREEDRARAAGRSVRRFLKQWQQDTPHERKPDDETTA